MSLKNKFLRYRENMLTGLWIDYKAIQTLVASLSNKLFTKSICGYSEKGIPIHRIDVGKGSIKIVLWSQMHGDESTATKLVFDVLNYIQAEYTSDKQLVNLLNKCTLSFIPMLNPDGSKAYTRENAKDIDINRDARTLQTKEGQVLNQLMCTIQPNFTFNLHDQDSFYNVQGTEQVATLSFLAPAADIQKTLTPARKKAMSVIYAMYQAIQHELPNQMGRYNDTYCSTCFGDQIQKLGIPTILIEAGYYPKDEAREETRKYHFIALMSALFVISSKKLPDYMGYFKIPKTDKLFYDIRFDNILYKGVITSIAIRYNDFLIKGKLTKVILKEQTIHGVQLKDKLFHRVIDAKGSDFSSISINNSSFWV